MRYGEAWRMFLILRDDPSSQVGAALGEFEYAMNREAMILADVFDLLARANTPPKAPKPKPYPRPWNANKRRVGKTDLSPDEAREVLATQFGKPEPAAPEDEGE